MEEEILKIITEMIYKDKLEELYKKRKENFTFPIKLNPVPNFKVIINFNEKMFSKYELLLIENAIIYALNNKENEYLNFFNNHIHELRKVLKEEVFFKAKTTELAIKNIVNKKHLNINTDLKTKENNKELFNKINTILKKVDVLPNIYRNIILNFLNTFNEYEKELHLDIFMLTNKYDKAIINVSKSIINKENINFYKNTLIRLIYSDNYILIKNILKEMNDEEDLNDYRDDEDEIDEEETYKETMNEILDFINECIENNTFNLAKNDELRAIIYSNFITFNSDQDTKEYEVSLIKNDKNNIKKLKKINPLYSFDISTNND